MSEAMTVETIVAAEWQLLGYWTRLRHPFQTSKSGWSDVDVLAYQPENRHLVIAESKVRGSKKRVWAYTTNSPENDILDYDKGVYFSFLKNIGLLCEPKPKGIFEDFKKMAKKLTIQLVSNYYIDDNSKTEARDTVLKQVRKYLPSGVDPNVDLDVKLDSTLEVIIRILREENNNPQGRRYGHPVLDIARELNRYIHPDISSAGGKNATKAVKREIMNKILRAFTLDEDLEDLTDLQVRKREKPISGESFFRDLKRRGQI